MAKKVLKYIGLVLGVLTFLPLVVAPFVYKAKVANVASDDTSVKLFEDLEGFEILVKDFNPFWITLVRILVIVALVAAVLLLVVSVVNDLKVAKLQNVEKLLALVLAVVGVVALVAVVINQFANSNYETAEVLGKELTTGSSLVANLIGWLFPVFAVVGGALVYTSVESPKKGKKKK